MKVQMTSNNLRIRIPKCVLSTALLLLLWVAGNNEEATAFQSRAVFVSRRNNHNRQPAKASSEKNQEQVKDVIIQDDDEDDSSSTWWKSVKMNDAALPLSVRADFPILHERVHKDKPLIYLDSAATSHKPTYVTDALTNYYETSNSNVHRGAHSLSQSATRLYEAARDKVASFINAYSRNEIVFTSGATEAINLIAGTFGQTLQEGDEIVVSVMEHHSNIVPWQLLSESRGTVLKFIPLKDTTDYSTTLDYDQLPTLLTPNTKLVSVQHASNVLGCVHDIETIVAQVRRYAHPDCKILLDACQSVPHMPVDVQTLNVDFIAASGHKMCGPTGIGFLWGREALLNTLPPYQGGGEMIQDVYLTHSTYADAPGRFEAGTPPIAQAVGLGAACDYMTQLTMQRVHDYEMELGDYLYRRMDEIDGIHILGPKDHRTAMVCFVCDHVHPSDLSTFLDMEGVAVRAGHHCCQPLHRELDLSHSARASLYFYNTKEEVDVFIQTLKDTVAFFQQGMMMTSDATGDGNNNGVEDGSVKDDDIFL